MKDSARLSVRTLGAAAALSIALAAGDAAAAIPPAADRASARATGHPDLFIHDVHLPLDGLPDALAAGLRAELETLRVAPPSGHYDVRAGRWGSLVLQTPLVPGPGRGNALTWAGLGLAAPADDAAYTAAVWRALTGWLDAHARVLGVDAAELPTPGIGTYEDRRLTHVYAERVHQGVPVRDAYLRATLVAGNLVLYTARHWGAIDVPVRASVEPEAAWGVVSSHLAGLEVSERGASALVLLPMARGAKPDPAASGSGYDHRLAWSFPLRVAGSGGSWEALVDAHTAELLSFHDRNLYLEEKKVVGGVFPVSNDGGAPGGVPDGMEQPDHPMSRAYVFVGAARHEANAEGLVSVEGEYRTSLQGPFVRIQDQCGAVNEVTSCDALDLGTGGGTDCARPPNHSLGDTHSARTGFFELNRLIDQAKSWVGPGATHNLPATGWLNLQLPANMNINNACNAFFSPADLAAPATGSINFYRRGAAGSNVCRNTGEIAAVFDHEWGHGLDTFDDSKGIATPGEAYADMAAVLRLDSSCVGRGFFLDNSTGGFCPGNGDVCTECTGVREVDWMKRYSRSPHDLAWVLDQNPTVPGSCPVTPPPATPFNSGPCQRSTHCEGTIISEAFWDLLKRDLPCHGRQWEAFPGGPVAGGRCKTGPRTMDDNAALVLVTRLFYLGGPGVKVGYQCDVRVGGCNADSWYMNMLAADDDDGVLANGTPHMVAISDAFRRHGIACAAPLPLDLGCVATPAPTTKPVVSAAAGVRAATVTWEAVPDAAEYWVLRTDGVHGCDFGKTRVARVPATSPRTFTQDGLLDGRAYYYSVVPVGGVVAAGLGRDACAGPVSACASVTPLPPPGGPGECAPPENRPPVAVDDAVSAPRNHARRLDVAANDADPDHDALVVSSVTDPGHGAAAVETDGRVVYTPEAGFEGTDSFEYVVSDGRGGSDTGRVTVAVAGDPCAEGFTVLSDPAGDSTGGRPEYDVRSASIAQAADGRFHFVLKMTSLQAPPPNSTWPITFAGGDGGFRFVKMATDPTGAAAFRYGNGSSASAPGLPADPESGFDADGTIRIVVPPSAIGAPLPGQQFGAFLTRIAFEIPGVGTLTPDNMPDSLVPGGSYEVVGCAAAPLRGRE
jgi:hypothetical protein